MFKESDFNRDNCALYTPVKIFMGIFKHSNGNPCDGCSYISRCNNYYKLHPDKKRPTKEKATRADHKPNIKKSKNKNKAAF